MAKDTICTACRTFGHDEDHCAIVPKHIHAGEFACSNPEKAKKLVAEHKKRNHPDNRKQTPMRNGQLVAMEQLSSKIASDKITSLNKAWAIEDEAPADEIDTDGYKSYEDPDTIPKSIARMHVYAPGEIHEHRASSQTALLPMEEEMLASIQHGLGPKESAVPRMSDIRFTILLLDQTTTPLKGAIMCPNRPKVKGSYTWWIMPATLINTLLSMIRMWKEQLFLQSTIPLPTLTSITGSKKDGELLLAYDAVRHDGLCYMTGTSMDQQDY